MKATAKKEHIHSLDEKTFRTELVIPLLRSIPGCFNITDIHGANERGIDVVYFVEDAMAPQPHCVAIQLKVGDIATTSGKGREGVSVLDEQISLAAGHQVKLTNPSGTFRISRIQVMTTGNISDNARVHLADRAWESHKMNVECLDGNHVIERLDKFFPDYWQYFDKSATEYYAHLKREFGSIEDISKLGTQRKFAVEQIYVPMMVTEMIDDDFVEYNENQNSQNIDIKPPEPIKEVELLDEEHRVFLIGETGSGKRVVLRHLLFEQLERNSQDLDGGQLPFLFEARQLLTENNLREALDSYLKNHSGGQLCDELEGKLVAQGALLLVDKLSRIPNGKDTRHIIDLCNKFCDHYPLSRCVVAFRDSQLAEVAEFAEFKRFQLGYFGSSQVTSLVKNWYEGLGQPNFSPEMTIQQIIRNVNQGALPRTPLVYTLNLVLLDNDDSQTSNIADLFDKYADLFLGKWNVELGIPQKYEFRLKKRFLSELAFHMTDIKVDCLSETSICELFGKIFLHTGLPGEPKTMLDELMSGGILIKEGDHFRFVLYVLQEFFAGVAMQLKENVTEELVASNLDKRYWGMSIIFYAGLKRECNYLLESIITIKETDDLVVQGYLSYMAGMIASNADQSESNLKREGVRYALLGSVMFMRRLSVILRDKYGPIGELHAGLFLDLMVFYSLGSPLLELQYKELLEEEEILSAYNLERYIFNETEKELPKFLLASLLLRFGLDGHEEALKDVASSPNPYILSLLNIRLTHYLKRRKEMEKSQPEPIKNWRPVVGVQTKLKSKLRKELYKDARRAMFRKTPVSKDKGYILPPPEKVLSRPTDYLSGEMSEDSDAETIS